jgi:TRAF3-interacting protein 1
VICSPLQGASLEVKGAKVVAGLEPENTSQFLILLGEYAADKNCDSGAAVRRLLNGEKPGDAPAAKRATAESKTDDRRESSSKAMRKDDDDGDVKGAGMDVPKHIDQMDVASSVSGERGKSRGGTRGGPRQPTSATALSGVSERPANMDSEIDKCDGSYDVTKDLLGSVITKPKLSEKLLSKPPFRFLHDVIMEVIRVTRFGEGLYSPEEMDSANVKEKEQKILFLEKMLKLVGVQLNTLVEAKPQKIVAGLEVQDTNRFLQLLALAAKMMPEAGEAVRTVLDQLGLSPAQSAPPSSSQAAAPASSQQQFKEDIDEPKRSEPQQPKFDERPKPVKQVS